MPGGKKSPGRRPRKEQCPKGEKNPFQKMARAAGPKKHCQLATEPRPNGRKSNSPIGHINGAAHHKGPFEVKPFYGPKIALFYNRLGKKKPALLTKFANSFLPVFIAALPMLLAAPTTVLTGLKMALPMLLAAPTTVLTGLKMALPMPLAAPTTVLTGLKMALPMPLATPTTVLTGLRMALPTALNAFPMPLTAFLMPLQIFEKRPFFLGFAADDAALEEVLVCLATPPKNLSMPFADFRRPACNFAGVRQPRFMPSLPKIVFLAGESFMLSRLRKMCSTRLLWNIRWLAHERTPLKRSNFGRRSTPITSPRPARPLC